MKRKGILLFFLIGLVLTGCTSANEPAVIDEVSHDDVNESVVEEQAVEAPTGDVKYVVDVKESRVEWHAKRILKDTHHIGHVPITEGVIYATDEDFVGGNFTLDMTSIVDEDLEGKFNEKLVGHVKSADFFDVETYPTSTLEIMNVLIDGQDEEGVKTYKITANLTIKGITNEVAFPAMVTVDGDTISATAEFSIDRVDWDVRYGSGSLFDDLGDSVISDQIGFKITLVATK